jgi:hypothetical protein
MLDGLGFEKRERLASPLLKFRSSIDRGADVLIARKVDDVVKNLKWCRANLDLAN